MDAEPTLYDALGGMPALRRLSDVFYERVLADELLAPVFANFNQRHVEHVAVWLAEVFGGPEQFTASLGGHRSLLHSHLGLGIRDEHRRRWLDLMSAAVGEALPDSPDLHASVMSYFEWGTAIAQEVSQDPVGTDLGEPGPTPRWGHQGLAT
ncbi:group II truncated hemoglobin [Promicromonospora sp. NFX87]|uniref:group II truncated hemoglobin n=1 Tax=Promicromonospora sp. NFX87 TaxID=3402691 RepID=UPI003AFB2AF1